MKSVFLLLNFLVLLVGCQVSEKTSSGSLISGHTPSSNVFTLVTPTAKTYVTGETLSLTLTFPFDVTVTGTPRLTMTVGATTRYADYTAGTGTTTLTFDYTFLAADNDSDGIAISALDLNGGTLTFDNNGVATNCAVASVTARTLTTTKVDNSGPTVSAFSLTNLPGFYNKNDVLSFSLTYSEAVIVTGTPRISVAFSTGGSLYATYAGGTGSTTLSFTMTIDNTMADTDGYAATSPIDLNSGTIQDSVGNTASLDISGYTAAAQVYSSTVDLDGRLPYVVSVTNPSNGIYVAAQSLEFSVEFDRAVSASGSPYLALTIGAATRQATYVSGTGTNTLLFRYVTIPGDVDADGIAVATTITQNSGTISGSSAPTMSYFSNASNNTFTISPTTGIIVNSVQPQAISFSRNIDSTSASWGTALDNVWNIGQDLLISVTFNTNMYVDQTSGTPRIPITIGAVTSYATYLSGGNGQTTLIFRYIVVEGVSDTDGTIVMGDIDLNGGSITDIANTNTLLPIPTPNITSTRIDGIRPTISSLAAPADGTYSTLVNMNFTMTWSEAVRYSSASSNLPLTIGATAVSAVYTSGTTTASIIYRPTLTGLTDIDGIAFSSSTLTGTATITDAAGNAATVLTFTPPVTTAVLVDTTAPTITSVSPPAAGTYTAGNTLDFAVTFSETVYVSSSGGYPRLALVLDSSTRYATYLSGSGTNTINFRYTVVANDSDLTGITNPTVVSVTNAPTAYIRDIAQNGGSSTSFAMTTSLAGVIVDALVPSVTSRTIPANGTYDSGDALNFVMTFNEIVNVTGTPRIQVTAQTGTLNFDYLSGSGTTALTFRYTVGSSDFDFDGLPTVVNTISLNGGTIQDVASNNATLTFTTANLSSVYLAYPNTVVWTTSTFTNRSAIAGLTLSSSGVATTQTIAGQIFRTFNGDDGLNLSSSITGAEVIYLVFKTNSALSTMDLLLTDVALLDDGAAFDLTTLDADITLDGVTSSSGTLHDVNMSVSTTHVLEVTFTTAANYSAGAFINSTFLGAIAEVIVVTAPLSPAEKSQISTYLNAKY